MRKGHYYLNRFRELTHDLYSWHPQLVWTTLDESGRTLPTETRSRQEWPRSSCVQCCTGGLASVSMKEKLLDPDLLLLPTSSTMETPNQSIISKQLKQSSKIQNGINIIISSYSCFLMQLCFYVNRCFPLCSWLPTYSCASAYSCSTHPGVLLMSWLAFAVSLAV